MTAVVHSREFEEGQREVLEQIASGARLSRILEQIVLLVERQSKDMLCSILLVDRVNGIVRHGASSRLPQAFTDRIDGAPIGPAAGSCGTAAFLGQRVIVEDIATHPYWEHYREIALPIGLRACWSTPIFSSAREVLGTFAMYYPQPRAPSELEMAWVDRATHLASIAINRDETNEAIFASERLRTLVYNGVADVLFYIGVGLDGSYRFLSVNPAFLKATGLRERDVVGRPVAAVIPEPSLSKVLAKYGQAIREGRTVRWDETSIYPAGKRYGEVSITPIFDERGRCTNLIGTVHDVTERKHAEEQIAAQAALLDQAKEAILVRDIGAGVRYWNKGAERLYGWSREEVLGRPITELIYRDERAFEEAQATLIERGEWSGELIQHTRDGRQIVVEGRWTLIREEEGQRQSVFAINNDITDRKKLELQLFRAQRLESLGTLAGGIAHDFNNILASIMANTGFAIGDLPQGHPAQDSLAEIKSASERAAALVRRILAFSRDHEPQRQVVELRPIVEEALRLLRATLPASISIQTDFAPSVPKIYADPTQVHQVVMNLGTNAAHAMEQRGGVLDVRVERWSPNGSSKGVRPTDLQPGNYARLAVRDTGSGMDAATLDRIFEPFFTTKERGKGTGLGLSVVHGVLKSHGGGVTVDSVVGQGSCFSAFFPAAKSADVDMRPVVEPLVHGAGERILCLDDEEAIVRVTVRRLKELGYHAFGQSDATRALESLVANPIDAVVTDLTMPRLSGTDLVRALLDARPGLPILVTSGRIEPQSLRALEQLGVREVLMKPASIEELGAALHRLLHGAPSPRHASAS